jgi:hypothetical protein
MGSLLRTLDVAATRRRHAYERCKKQKFRMQKAAPILMFLRLTTVGGEGVRPGVDLNNSAALLSLMEQGT